MDFGQILQVVLSLGVVALALYLSARLARRRLGPGSDEALRVVARQSVSRTQNLVVVEANGHRHLVALTDGGAHTVETWDVPVEAVESGAKHAAPRSTTRPALTLPALARPAPTMPASTRSALARRSAEAGSPDAPAPSLPALRGRGRRAKTAAPAPGRTAEPTPERTAEPTPERTAAPAPGRTAEPTPERTAEPTAKSGVGSFAAKLAALQAQTQWAPLGQRK